MWSECIFDIQRELWVAVVRAYVDIWNVERVAP